MSSQSSVILEVHGLSVHYPGASAPAVHDVAFSLESGRTLGIVGESGSGKSTLCLALLGLLPPRTEVAGSVQFLGRDLASLDRKRMRSVRGKEIGLIYQDPMAALNPARTVGSQMREPLMLQLKMSAAEADREAIRLLDRVGIADPRSKLSMYPFELSGGMQQRVVIAMAISCNPTLVIADEPTTALDVTVQAQVLHLLAELQADLSLTMVFISHDLSVVASVSDHILVMRHGREVEYGSVANVLTDPQHTYTRELIDSLLVLEGPRGDSPLGKDIVR